jgi:hypothetical protein
MVTFADPVDGVPFTDPDGLDDRTLWLRAYNGVGELVAATEPVWLVDARRGPVDQLGGVDPVPVTGSLLNPTDGALQSVSTGFVWNDGTGLHSACGGSWSANETHVLVATGDRDGLVSFYLDDMTTPAATADLSAAATLTNTDAVGTLPPSDLLQVGAWAKWDRVLTAAELAVLPARLDA